MRRAFSHVGIYVGDGKFIHSPKPGAEVRVESMGVSYWQRRFDGARRVQAPGGAETQHTTPQGPTTQSVPEIQATAQTAAPQGTVGQQAQQMLQQMQQEQYRR
jgi:cell wall-associated NlpC family hydrolase